MANIYLRVPAYLAQYYRHRDTRRMLSEREAVVFSPFEHASVIMETWLTLVPEQGCEHGVCFSQRMWNNMMKGRRPQGGKVIIDRDDDEWVSLDEVNALMGTTKSKKFANNEYLCIQTPKKITSGTEERVVTPSFTLPASAAYDLIRELRQSYVRVLLRWIRNTMTLCDVKGIRRDVAMAIDMFFYHYNMVVDVNQNDRDSMRRMATRWMEEAKLLPEEIDDEDVTFIYERERATQDVSIDALLANVKERVKRI